MIKKELIENCETVNLMDAVIFIKNELSERGWENFYCEECGHYHETDIHEQENEKELTLRKEFFMSKEKETVVKILLMQEEIIINYEKTMDKLRSII